MERKLRLYLVFVGLLVGAFSSFIQARDKSGNTPNVPVFRSSARIVLVDVVATDSNGKPVRDLKPQDFEIYDDGKRQTIRGFDPHTVDEKPGVLIEQPPVLGPGIYTNWTPAPASGAINVILFDTLNLDAGNQAYARMSMIKYLKTLPPGQQVALFTLGNRLRMVQGITGSTDRLIAAANKLGALSKFQTSDGESPRAALDKMGTPSATSTQSPAAVLQTPPPGIHTPETILQDFTQAEVNAMADARMRITLAALRDLARTLGAIPGRKNLMWVAGDFPAFIGSYTERSGLHLYDREIRTTAASLAAHQIALYPIDARGLLTYPIGEGRSDFSERLNSTHSAMEEIAQQTGGRAFYNTNGIANAIGESIASGSSYYTVSYAPSNKKWDGSLRKIAVKVARSNVKLTYRRGYYAVSDPFAPVLKIKTTDVDVQKRLIEAVQPGSPQSSGILVKAKTVATDASKPVEIDYVIDARNLTLQQAGDGTRKVSYQLVAVAWDKKQKNAAQAWEMVDKEISPEHASDILRKGIKSRRFLTLKPGEYELYLGLIDVESKKIGTLVIPLEIPEATTSTANAPSDRHEEVQPATSIGSLGSALVSESTTNAEADPFEGAMLEGEEPSQPSSVVTGVTENRVYGPDVEPATPAAPEVFQKEGEAYTFRTAVREVLVDAGVRDTKKRLVSDLKRQDFRILEDGVEQPIVGFWHDQLPIAVALVLDRSASMTKSIEEMQRTAAQILSGLKPQDKVALFAFDSEIEKMVDLTTDRQRVADALGNIKAGDSTDAVNALFVATLYLKQNAPDMRRVLIFVSDNKSVSFTITKDGHLRSEIELIDTALQCGAAIYDLRIANRESKSTYPYLLSMNKVTEQTGGEMISSSSAPKMLEEVIQTLRKRYVLSFKPAQKGPGGRLHTIELRLAPPMERLGKYSIRYNRGYRTTPIRDYLSEGFRIANASKN